MTRIALTGGDYQSSSIIASSQRCCNLYPEEMDPAQGEPTQMTYYQTPGLTLLSTAPEAPIRGMYRASNGDLYIAAGFSVYYVSPTWTFTLIGSWQFNSRNTIVMSDNGTNIIAVDGTTTGFTFLMATRSGWTQILDSGFLGATYVDFTDTFFILNFPGTPTFYISGAEAVTFDPLDFAGKSSKPDFLVAAVVSHRVIWLIGTESFEVWNDSGPTAIFGTLASGVDVNNFPFSAIPGVQKEDGCAAVYSIAKTDTKILWLAQNVNGSRYVLLGSGYQTVKVSNHAIESVFQTYDIVSDALGYCYNQRGHYFYVLSFPSADATWVYDLNTKKWHERVWMDVNGLEHRHRGAYHAYAYDNQVVGDWENGNLYNLDLNNFTDNGMPIKRLRSFPQMMDTDNNNRVIHKSFTADMDVAMDTNSTDNPEIYLSWSDDRGKSFNNPILQSLGQTGQYQTQINFNRLGMARTRVYQLEWSGNFNTALNGAFVEIIMSGS